MEHEGYTKWCVYGVKHGREIQGCDRPLSHIQIKIVLNVKEGTFS